MSNVKISLKDSDLHGPKQKLSCGRCTGVRLNGCVDDGKERREIDALSLIARSNGVVIVVLVVQACGLKETKMELVMLWAV